MGLDIIAYSRVELVENPEMDEWDEEALDNSIHQVWLNPSFPGRADELQTNKFYKVNGYEIHFRAGSYGGYNAWREDLAILAGYGSAQNVWAQGDIEGPFIELINFSDCEGVIGSKVSAKLYKDFVEYQERASQYSEDHQEQSWFYAQYERFMEAFKLASDNGYVWFC